MKDSCYVGARNYDKPLSLSMEMIMEAYNKSHGPGSFFEVLLEHTGNSKGELLMSLANALG